MATSRLGPFALEEKLGGPQSSVYRAVHIEQKRQVALKVFSAPMAASQAGKDEFSDEVALLKRLQNAGAVRCYGGSLDKNMGYLALELVTGGTLADLIDRRGRISWDQVVEYAIQMAGAMQEAHELGLTHFDLSPDKVLLTADGKAKIADFRRERQKNPFCVSSQKRTPTRLAFQSPEQIDNLPNLTPKADLFAFGCLLYAMLTGHPPIGEVSSRWAGESLDDIAQRQRQLMPPRVSSLVLDCPVWLDALVDQLLQLDPAKRPHSAGAVLLALHEMKRKVAAGSSVAEHAAGGFSAIKLSGDRAEAGRVLGVKRQTVEQVPLHERPWFIGTALSLAAVVVVVISIFALWPKDDAKLLAEVNLQMSQSDSSNWSQLRRDYLEPLQARHPNDEIGTQVQQHIDTIDKKLAENLVKRRMSLGLPLPSEGAKQFAEAVKLEQFGDQAEARKRFEAMLHVLQPTGEDRPYYLLAQDRVAKGAAEAESAPGSTQEFVAARLAEAEALIAQQKTLEASKVLQGIISLYGNNPEMAPLVLQAREQLANISTNKPAAKPASP